MNLRINPRIERLKPRRTSRSFDWLRYSCQKFGIQHPIIHNSRGWVLDGTRRLRIARDSGLTYETKQIDLGTSRQEEEWVLTLNLSHPDPHSVQVKILEYLIVELAALPDESVQDTINRIVQEVSYGRTYDSQRLKKSCKYGSSWSRLGKAMRKWIFAGHQVSQQAVDDMLEKGEEVQARTLETLDQMAKNKTSFRTSYGTNQEVVEKVKRETKIGAGRMRRVAEELGMAEIVEAAGKLENLCKT